ncbi:ArsR family transcriptional regulator [Alkalihalobacillus alcalophilus ATCC 27647 = CGMCC 1.3604]|uniref:ArsR family transcriptional regulator n=1 Tax=Alkalihalobacillus alcalophilus ATCC 27647 = CGMCC 1.3604 TaxID=1218173 RepID=A0A094XHW9_ALKAL|nr:autorepressor SdpR family transcription factor [Alkalihalobacillus alcalophilus]KGA98375.1 ArsR family transcriptional regulator [Alkalihalobacillus alcalophilus ATCC 27647 = CGMCC 1.3604]MED1563674.1 autorepressor SdpR family transcription factor [Alkalihalobacillus alcalophilus]THG91599.1 ArsR family transcriptional regulator [Alkalihalobacillus alcalophilus ATCC 27647 = CGMCC 1.3604]
MNDVFKILADPTRRKILELLKEQDLTAGQIYEHFTISKPSISHHLSLLKSADLVVAERKGQHIYYSINTSVFQDIIHWVLHFREKN